MWTSDIKMVFRSDYHCYCCDALVHVTGRVQSKPQRAECGLVTCTVRLPRIFQEKLKLSHTGSLWPARVPMTLSQFLCFLWQSTKDKWLTQQKCIVLQFWSFRVKVQGITVVLNCPVALSLVYRWSFSSFDFSQFSLSA
jgi:hypothetical protein